MFRHTLTKRLWLHQARQSSSKQGTALDAAKYDVVDFETMNYIVLNHPEIKSKERHQFKWDSNTKDIITKYISRSIKSTIKEKRTIDGFDTLPFGYENY